MKTQSLLEELKPTANKFFLTAPLSESMSGNLSFLLNQLVELADLQDKKKIEASIKEWVRTGKKRKEEHPLFKSNSLQDMFTMWLIETLKSHHDNIETEGSTRWQTWLPINVVSQIPYSFLQDVEQLRHVARISEADRKDCRTITGGLKFMPYRLQKEGNILGYYFHKENSVGTYHCRVVIGGQTFDGELVYYAPKEYAGFEIPLCILRANEDNLNSRGTIAIWADTTIPQNKDAHVVYGSFQSGISLVGMSPKPIRQYSERERISVKRFYIGTTTYVLIKKGRESPRISKLYTDENGNPFGMFAKWNIKKPVLEFEALIVNQRMTVVTQDYWNAELATATLPRHVITETALVIRPVELHASIESIYRLRTGTKTYKYMAEITIVPLDAAPLITNTVLVILPDGRICAKLGDEREIPENVRGALIPLLRRTIRELS